ncbi:hypothetical protein Hanom_Chr08g00717671 [Helianthus anomalus]
MQSLRRNVQALRMMGFCLFLLVSSSFYLFVNCDDGEYGIVYYYFLNLTLLYNFYSILYNITSRLLRWGKGFIL